MAKLSIAYGKELSPALIDIYWEALKPLAIEQLQRGADSWIRHHKFFPKASEILDRFKEMEQAASKPAPELPPADAKWLRHVNSLFLRYLMRRRIDDVFQGDIDLLVRREKCIELAQWFEGMESEGDPEATEAELKKRFEAAMARIPDAGWKCVICEGFEAAKSEIEHYLEQK